MEINKEATKPENRQDDVETLKAICAEIVEQYERHREEEKQWFDESPAFIMERFGLPMEESMWAWVQACTMNHYNKKNSVEISTNSITEDEIKEALEISDTDGKLTASVQNALDELEKALHGQ